MRDEGIWALSLPRDGLKSLTLSQLNSGSQSQNPSLTALSSETGLNSPPETARLLSSRCRSSAGIRGQADSSAWGLLSLVGAELVATFQTLMSHGDQ